MATKKQNKHYAVRKLRRALKNTWDTITRLPRSIVRYNYGAGPQTRAFSRDKKPND